MALADTLLAQQKRPGVPCTLGRYIADLSDQPAKGEPSARQQLVDVIRDERISTATIADYLLAQDVKVTKLTVGKHRRGKCIGCDDAGWFA